MIEVSDASQTEEIFASALGQYEGISEAIPTVEVIATTRHSLWADVTWSYDGTAAERYMYQLVQSGDTWRIAVLSH